MAKLLESRLPLALNSVDSTTFNRLVRVLEINLGQFDPNSTPQFIAGVYRQSMDTVTYSCESTRL